MGRKKRPSVNGYFFRQFFLCEMAVLPGHKGVPSVFLLRSLRSLRKTDGTPGRYPLSVKGIALGDLAATTHQDATYVYVCASIDCTFADCVTCDIISAHALNYSCHDFSSLVWFLPGADYARVPARGGEIVLMPAPGGINEIRPSNGTVERTVCHSAPQLQTPSP